MKFIYLLLIPLLLNGETFEKKEGEFSVKMTTSPFELNLDDSFSLKLDLAYPKSFVLDQELLRKSVMTPTASGIYPLYLFSETVQKNDSGAYVHYVLKPQHAGEFKIDLGLKFPFSVPSISLRIPQEKDLNSDFPIAPLMPLVKGDPLELSLKLRKILYQESHAKENLSIFKSRTYPWGQALGALILLFLAPFALRYWLQNMPKTQKLDKRKEKNVLEELNKLKERWKGEPKALSFIVSELFKEGFQPFLGKDASSMTFEELLEGLGGHSTLPLGEIKRLFTQFEKMQFQKSVPEKGEVEQALGEAAEVLGGIHQEVN